nr:HLA class II histocompatibility antigen, DQ beta 1 chain-like isoform X3 [Pelodiscus sinensis]XP_025043898.1 HLA class II histocompatibility antigen, DQ beta 1 chain-like isoform X3 [Pelodiscus sinensis]|eukprot:XP_025043897.1 HLA class II histocompatibility antigen, DQ beta 1 chain-like isoform X3 [Pelodiscus sinensis]
MDEAQRDPDAVTSWLLSAASGRWGQTGAQDSAGFNLHTKASPSVTAAETQPGEATLSPAEPSPCHVPSHALKGAEPYYMQILKTCELDDATGTVQIATRCSLNGEDVLHYRGDQNRWFSVHPAAWRVAERWNQAAEVFGAMNHLTPQQCQSWIQSSASFIAQQTAQPTGHMALVPRTEARPRRLICHVTGFYPRPIKVTWEQGEQDALWEQLSSGILPNGDHTFQIQVSIELGQEGAGPTEHVCVVRHSSLANTTLRVTWVQPTGRLHVPHPLGEYLSWASGPGTRNPQAFPHPLLAALSHKLGRKEGDHSSQQVPRHRPRSPPISCWS